MRSPVPRMGPSVKANKILGQPGKISGWRLFLAFMGLLVGIVASFCITGLGQATAPDSSTPQAHIQQRAPTQNGNAEEVDVQDNALTQEVVFSWKDFPKTVIISFVICMLTFQGLYQPLKLYQNEPAWLVLFVAFQYGYFWQSVIKGGIALI